MGSLISTKHGTRESALLFSTTLLKAKMCGCEMLFLLSAEKNILALTEKAMELIAFKVSIRVHIGGPTLRQMSVVMRPSWSQEKGKSAGRDMLLALLITCRCVKPEGACGKLLFGRPSCLCMWRRWRVVTGVKRLRIGSPEIILLTALSVSIISEAPH